MSYTAPENPPTSWPPAPVPSANTTHPSAVRQTYVDGASGALSDGRDINSLGYDASSGGGAPTYSTTATAGTPGSFNGTNIPNSLADLQAARPNAVTGGANWTAGQYVVTENGDRANWNGSAWLSGAHA